MQSDKIPFVAIYMITYNHERYIAQAIESVMMQQTGFEYKLFIGEDGSKDNTRAICQALKAKYPYKIELVLNDKNIGATRNARQIYQYCFTSGAKYIAMLEGDDFWSDENKLQKQIDVLERHANLVLSHSDVSTIDGAGTIKSDHHFKTWNYQNPDIDYRFSIFSPIAFTCTAVFRNVLSVDEMTSGIESGDWMLWILLTLKGDAKFINEKLAVYRLGSGLSENAVWHKDFYRRALFLLGLITLKNPAIKNKWLFKGALYFALNQGSEVLKINKLSQIAGKLKYTV